MPLNRRTLIAGTAGLAATAGPAITAYGLDAGQFGVRPGHPDDQSRSLQRAIDRAAAAQAPLVLAPGVYHAGKLRLPSGAQVIGVRGATRLMNNGSEALFAATGATHVTLSGLVLDGDRRPLPTKSGLLRCEDVSGLRIVDCEIMRAGGNAVFLIKADGEIAGNAIVDTADVAIQSFDGRGLTIARNTVQRAGNNGIQILRWNPGEDGTMILDNRIEEISDRDGGTGQFGNGVNAHKAANVIVRGNRIRDCAFSAVRGNSANDIQIVGNSVSNVGEVALYSEFSFEGAIVSGNTVDGAAIGVSVCNFNEGGRMAVVSGNIVRRLKPRRPPSTAPDDKAGFGIYVEADSTVYGNIVEDAPWAGIMLGYGRYLRDVSVTGNVIRGANIGVAVSVTGGVGGVLIADNVIAGPESGAIVGMDHARVVTGDLLKAGLSRYGHITASGNRVT